MKMRPRATHRRTIHDCGKLFGCGDEKGTGVVREDIKDGAFGQARADRLMHMDEVARSGSTAF